MSLISLSQERLKRQRILPPKVDGYYCLKCDSDLFKLYASGEIHCANCGARMTNLFLRMEAVPA